MIIDVHTHVFPDGLAARAVATMEASAKLPGLRAAEDGTLAALRRSMQRNNITCSVTVPVATQPEHVPGINRYVIETLHHETGVIAFGALHPRYAAWEHEIARLVNAGIKGVKLHPEFQEFQLDAPEFVPFLRAIAAAGLVVLLHMGDDYFATCAARATPRQLARVLDTVDGLRVIAAHAGGFMRWQEVLDCLAKHPRVWLDVAFCAGALPDEMRRRLFEAHGYERVLLGSDFPWVSQDATIAYVRSWRLPAALEAAVLGGNAAQLLTLA